jgi:cation:H+ antiporter
MHAQTIVLFLAGLVLLIGGAELLVRGASRLAAALGISPLVIGLTVVAFGTGSPELAVGAQAAFSGKADLAVGNVVGSNIFNTLAILGLSALAAPLVVASQLVRFDVPVMILVSIGLLALAGSGTISQFEGAVLVAGILAYTAILVALARRSGRPVADPDTPVAEHARRGWGWQIALVVAGLALLLLGSRWLVDGAVAVAVEFGVSELVIGLTIVAAGTSLPEVATSVVAGLRGERDIAVGNVVGSNIYNILAVLGVGALIAPGGLPVAPGALNFDIPVMIAAAVACLPVFFATGVVTRWQGALFLGYWLIYTAYVILQAGQHDSLPAFNRIMTRVVLPLTAATLLLTTLRALRTRRSGSESSSA